MKIHGIDWTIGADPELFIHKKGVVQNAFGLIEGNKQHPLKVKDGAVQVDGMALEFNIDPCSSKEEFNDKLTSVMDQLIDMVDGYEVLEYPTAKFSREIFDNACFEAKNLGCEPDFNAYTMEKNKKPKIDQPVRTAGGHIHIGGFPTTDIHSDLHMQRCQKLTKLMDYYVGLPSLLWDDDVERRKMYGQAGSFRPKPYGMEYRTLSNKWIFNEKVRNFVYDRTLLAINEIKRFIPYDFNPKWINNSNKGFVPNRFKIEEELGL